MIRLADIHRPPCSPPLTVRFGRWYGHPMSPRQKAVVELLEHQRLRQRRAAYLLVNDPERHDDVRRIIIEYLRWYTTEIAPQFRPVLLAHRPADLRRLLRGSDLHFIRRTSYSVTALRGQTHHAVAAFDVDRWLRHRSPDGCGTLLRTVTPMMTRTNPCDILILHGSGRRAGSFARLWKRNSASARYLILDVPTLTCNLDVDPATPQRWLRPPAAHHGSASGAAPPGILRHLAPRRYVPAPVAVTDPPKVFPYRAAVVPAA